MKKTVLIILAIVVAVGVLIATAVICANLGNDNDDIGGANADNDGGNANDNNNGGNTDNNSNGQTHIHAFDKQKLSADYVAEEATCQKAAKYYYSCDCGEKGIQTFEYGTASACKFENGVCKWCGIAERAATEGLIFTLTNNGQSYMLTGYEGDAIDVYIPSVYNGKPVVNVIGYSFEENKTLESVTMGNNIKYIGSHAFADCINLKTVKVGSDVTEIGEYAFGWCKSLESVELPNSLTLIKDNAFWMCGALPEITIPYSVTSIGKEAFARCDSLKSVTIPANVVSIANAAFYWCPALESINVDDDNPNYSSLDGNLYNKDKTTFLQYAIGKTDTSFAIPDSVTSIGYYAFAYCYNVVDLEIPNSVTFVDYYIFTEATGFKYNTKDGLNYLGNSDNPYLYLVKAANKRITTAVIDDNCKFIGDFAFSFCTSLSEVVFGEDSKLQSIGSSAFFYCGSLKTITIPEGVTRLDAPFYACSSLTNIVLKNTEGWYITSSRDDFNKKENGTAFDMTDSAANVVSFLETYNYHYWYRVDNR